MALLKGQHQATGDLDLANHRIKNWRTIDDLPTEGATFGQLVTLDSDGKASWQNAPTSSSPTSITASTGLSATGSTGAVTLAWEGTTNTRQAMVVWSIAESSTLTTGLVGWIPVPFSGQITEGWVLLDQSGSIQIDVWKDTFVNHPATDGDSITSGNELAVSSGVASKDTTLTDWILGFDAGDIFYFNIDSVATATQVTIGLRVLKDI